MGWRLNLLLVVSFGALMFLLGAVAENWWTDNQREYIALLPADRRPVPKDYYAPTKYFEELVKWDDYSGAPTWLMARLLDTESWWNPHATSYMGARGLAQIMDANLPMFAKLYNGGAPVDPYDPHTALRIAPQYFMDLLALTGDWGRAVAAYNAGPYTPPLKWKAETVQYVKQIWERP